MEEATKSLSAAEAGAKKQTKVKAAKTSSKFAPGLEWEVILADAVILNGLTNVLRWVARQPWSLSPIDLCCS
jgi:hypothetical protein